MVPTRPPGSPAEAAPGRRVSAALAGVAALAVALPFVAACTTIDTEERLGTYLDDRSASLPDGGTAEGSTCELSGTYLLAVQTDLGGPILFDTAVEVRSAGDGTFLLDLTLQPLKSDLLITGSDREDARTPTGEPIVAADVACADGEFSMTFVGLSVPDDANPVTGTIIVADLTFAGYGLASDAFCGTIAGELLQPLEVPDLGGTFGAVLTDDPMAVEVVDACPPEEPVEPASDAGSEP